MISYTFAEPIFFFLLKPLSNLFMKDESRRLIYTGLTEAFITYLKIAFFSAFFISFPVIASQVWLFIAPGLYKHERKAFLPFLIATPGLFLAGAALAYYVVCPLAWSFFLSFEVPPAQGPLSIQLEARVSEYLSLMIKLIFAFGISFQLPVFLTLMAYFGMLSYTTLSQNRKYAFLGIVVVAALITPPDLLSPLSLIIPLYGLYEISLIFVKHVEKKVVKTMYLKG